MAPAPAQQLTASLAAESKLDLFEFPARRAVMSKFDGWVVLPPEAVPERWANRAEDAAVIPLLPGEAEGLLVQESIQPELSVDDERILNLVARGLSIAAIASQLRVGERTVDRRLKRLRAHYGLTSKAEMETFFARRGFGDDAEGANP